MTPVYKVKTKHEKEVLKAFIKLTYRVRHPKSTSRLCIFGIMLFFLAYAFNGTLGTYICAGLGGVFIVFAFTRQNIALRKLMANDELYQKQTEVQFTFGESEWVIHNGLSDPKQHIKYGEINVAYKDSQYYYLSVNNQELHVLPRKDFIQGDEEAFQDFLEGKIGEPLKPLNIPRKEKWRIFKEALAIAWEQRGEKPKEKE
ncbi:YcxB family protein [Lachnospiraceae bacterium LCP25S3_G4]